MSVVCYVSFIPIIRLLYYMAEGSDVFTYIIISSNFVEWMTSLQDLVGFLAQQNTGTPKLLGDSTRARDFGRWTSHSFHWWSGSCNSCDDRAERTQHEISGQEKC